MGCELPAGKRDADVAPRTRGRDCSNRDPVPCSMATSTTAPSRILVGWLIALAGLTVLTLDVLYQAIPDVGFAEFDPVIQGALTSAFLLMAIGQGVGILPRIAYGIGTIGWGNLSVGSLVRVDEIFSIAVAITIFGCLASGIVGMIQHVYGRGSDLWFVMAMFAAALVLYNEVHGFPPPIVSLVISVLYGSLLSVAGLLIALRR
jgi:hypothetical protein